MKTTDERPHHAKGSYIHIWMVFVGRKMQDMWGDLYFLSHEAQPRWHTEEVIISSTKYLCVSQRVDLKRLHHIKGNDNDVTH